MVIGYILCRLNDNSRREGAFFRIYLCYKETDTVLTLRGKG